MPSDEEILQVIRRNLSTIPSSYHKEIGFFGGTFTGLPLEGQRHLLDLAHPFLESGEVDGIRVSTHPLCISRDIVGQLKRGGVETVELGVQSLDDDVLRASGRGYTALQALDAAKTIKDAGLKMGMQMMVGLPADTPEKCQGTAQGIVAAGADNTRIYPTLVVRGTPLAALFQQGKYVALSIDEAVQWTAPVLRLFQESGITVLRVGLHPTEGFINGSDYLAGPFHVAFKELVQTEIWRREFGKLLRSAAAGEADKGFWRLHVAPSQLNSAVGHMRSNKEMLQRHCGSVRFVPDDTLKNYEYIFERA